MTKQDAIKKMRKQGEKYRKQAAVLRREDKTDPVAAVAEEVGRAFEECAQIASGIGGF